MDRSMVFNAEAERAALAALMFCDRKTAHIIHDLSPEDFYIPAHREVFGAIADIVARGEGPGLTTVDEELIKRGTLDGIGGTKGLAEIFNSHFSPSLIRQDIAIIHELSARRRLKAISDALAAKAFDRLEDVTTTVLDTIGEIRKISLTDNQWVDMMQVAVSTYDLMERIARGEETFAKTGFGTIDADFMGFKRGSLTVIGARPASGKSAFIAQIIQHLSRQGHKVGFFSLEMEKHEYGMRLFAKNSGVALDDIQESNRLTEDGWRAVSDALPVVAGINMLYVEDAFTIEDIVARAWQMVQRAGVTAIAIDHMHLVHTKKRTSSPTERVSIISRELKQLALQLNVPVIAMAQLNRSSENTGRNDKRPVLTDLRDSGTIEQDADCVMMMHAFKNPNEEGVPDALRGLVESECKRKCAIVNVRGVKQRMGSLFETNLHFNGSKMLFTELGA